MSALRARQAEMESRAVDRARNRAGQVGAPQRPPASASSSFVQAIVDEAQLNSCFQTTLMQAEDEDAEMIDDETAPDQLRALFAELLALERQCQNELSTLGKLRICRREMQLVDEFCARMGLEDTSDSNLNNQIRQSEFEGVKLRKKLELMSSRPKEMSPAVAELITQYLFILGSAE